jgi:hypothetical protein
LRGEGVVRRLQVGGQRVELIPQRRRPDLEPAARHLSHLAGQGQMIGVLRDGDRHGKVHGIPPAGDELGRPQCRLDAVATPAPILLPLVPDDSEGAFHDVDLVGLLELSPPLPQFPAALGTELIRLIERMHDVDDRQPGLCRRAVALARVAGGVGRPVAGAFLGRGGEERPRAVVELFREELNFELQRAGVAAGGPREVVAEFNESTMQPIELGPLQERHLTQALDVGLRLDRHGRY